MFHSNFQCWSQQYQLPWRRWPLYSMYHGWVRSLKWLQWPAVWLRLRVYTYPRPTPPTRHRSTIQVLLLDLVYWGREQMKGKQLTLILIHFTIIIVNTLCCYCGHVWLNLKTWYSLLPCCSAGYLQSRSSSPWRQGLRSTVHGLRPELTARHNQT